MYIIMKSALEAFAELGYTATGIRDIAQRAGVSLGLINHYFGSKRNLGAKALGLMWAHVTIAAQRLVTVEDDPLLFEAVTIRALNTLLLRGKLRQFYLDSLKEDIFFDGLSVIPDESLALRVKKYNCTEPTDVILLYSRYIPYTVEKTLVLKKEEGMFSTVPYEDIPLLICQSAMSRYIPEDEIIKSDIKSRAITASLLQNMDEMPPDNLISGYIEQIIHPQS